MRSIVIVPDLQVPYHSRPGTAALARFIEQYKPDQVACVGDLIDMPQISQWTKGTSGEHSRDLHKHRNEAIEVIDMLKINVISRANHEDRLFKSISQRLPGIGDLPEMQIENFLDLRNRGITYAKDPYPIAPGWRLMHGDEGTQSQRAGLTGAGLANRIGYSVVCGHTHRLGLVPTTMMVGGKITRTLWGFEVGAILNLRSSGFKYTKGSANWQMGFGILHVQGNTVFPQPVPIQGRSFVVDSEKYSW
jgi:hypothetical protein